MRRLREGWGPDAAAFSLTGGGGKAGLTARRAVHHGAAAQPGSTVALTLNALIAGVDTSGGEVLGNESPPAVQEFPIAPAGIRLKL